MDKYDEEFDNYILDVSNVGIERPIRNDEEIEDIVKNNEPNIALYADNNGLYFYEQILKSVSKYLNDKYLIAFEIGYLQGEKIKEYTLKYLPDSEVIISQDLSNRDRFVFIKNKD